MLITSNSHFEHNVIRHRWLPVENRLPPPADTRKMALFRPPGTLGALAFCRLGARYVHNENCCSQAAVHGKDDPGDPRGSIGCEEERSPGDVLGLADAVPAICIIRAYNSR